MVSEYLRRMLRAFEVIAKLLEAFYDSEQLAVVLVAVGVKGLELSDELRFICTLRWIQLSRPESD
jgi:hypothetical protein